MSTKQPNICSIGTTESHHAVGLSLDAFVYAEHDARMLSVIAGVSVQDARGVHAIAVIPPEVVDAQLASLADTAVHAYRIGALPDVEGARRIAQRLEGCGVPVVYDPVGAASAGGCLADGSTLEAIVETLLPAVDVITPNIAEASAFTGMRIANLDEMIAAAQMLQRRGARSVLLKGGHLAGDPCDVLLGEEKMRIFREKRLPGEMRGTGCLVAASLAVALARGAALEDAVEHARAFVRGKLASPQIIGGMRTAY